MLCGDIFIFNNIPHAGGFDQTLVMPYSIRLYIYKAYTVREILGQYSDFGKISHIRIILLISGRISVFEKFHEFYFEQ